MLQNRNDALLENSKRYTLPVKMLNVLCIFTWKASHFKMLNIHECVGYFGRVETLMNSISLNSICADTQINRHSLHLISSFYLILGTNTHINDESTSFSRAWIHNYRNGTLFICLMYICIWQRVGCVTMLTSLEY